MSKENLINIMHSVTNDGITLINEISQRVSFHESNPEDRPTVETMKELVIGIDDLINDLKTIKREIESIETPIEQDGFWSYLETLENQAKKFN